jgi:Tol biopolymer transport system component
VTVRGPDAEGVMALRLSSTATRLAGIVAVVALTTGCLVGPPASFAPQTRTLRATQHATHLERLTNGPQHEMDPAVSPGGLSLAYDVIEDYDRPSHVEVKSLASGDVMTISNGGDDASMPSWIDDQLLLYVRRGPDDKVARPFVDDLFPQTSAKPVPYVFANVDIRWPSMTTNGGRIVEEISHVVSGSYTAMRYETRELYLLDRDGLDQVKIGDGRSPAFSPDGKRLAYTGAGGRVVVADTKRGAPIYYLMPGEMPTFDPSGARIAFCAAGDEGGTDLFVIPAVGGDVVQLTSGSGEACKPAWSTDGYIYFHANAEKSFDLWRIRPEP